MVTRCDPIIASKQKMNGVNSNCGFFSQPSNEESKSRMWPPETVRGFCDGTGFLFEDCATIRTSHFENLAIWKIADAHSIQAIAAKMSAACGEHV